MAYKSRKGGGSKPHTPVESPDSLHSVAKAQILMALGEGEIAGGITSRDIFLDGTPLQSADGTMNFQGVTWDFRPGTQTQDPIPGMPVVTNEIGVGTELKKSSPWVKRINNNQLDAIGIRLGFPRMTTTKSNGDTVGARVDYRIELSTADGPYVTVINGVADGKTTTLYERTHKIDLPKTNSHWDIRVTRITDDSSSDLLSNKTNIEAYQEIIYARLRYPNTALLYVEFDSKQFNDRIPKISVRMKGRIIRVPRNYDPEARTYSGAWDGMWKMAYSNNPAWIAMDVLTNERFGAGQRITVDQVDKWELYRLAQYCDALVPDGSGGLEPRHEFNVCIQSQNQAYNVIRDIASAFNAMVSYQNNQVVIRGDIPDDVVKVVTNANIVTGMFEYQGGSVKDRHSVAQVSFSNPELNYDDDLEPVSVFELVRRYQVNTIDLTAIGCTRRSEARRRGLWALLSNSSDRTVHFRTGLDGLSYKVGSIIGVADAFTAGHRMGGRIASASGTLITVDALPAKMRAGGKVHVNTAGGVAETRTVRNIISNTQFTVDRTFDFAPQQGEIWTLDETSFLQEDGSAGPALVIQQFRVTSITDNDDNTFNVVGVIHQPTKYAEIDTGVKITRPPISDIPSSVVKRPENVTISSQEMIWQGLTVQTLRVSWDRSVGAVYYEAQWKRDNQDWVNVPQTPSLGFEVPGIYQGDYQARVRAVNAIGASSLWSEAMPVRLNGKEGKPPALANITTVGLPWAIQVDFTYSPGSEDCSYIELQNSISATDGTAWQQLSNIPYPGTRFNHYGLKAGAIFFYRARTVDKFGNTSDWFGPVGGQSSIDADEYLGDLANQFMTEEDGRRLLEEANFDPESIINEALARHANVVHQMAQFDNARADIIEIRQTIADDQKALADFQTNVQSQFNQNNALLSQKMTAYTDANSANAFYTLKLGLKYNGQNYDAGLSVAAMASGGTVKTRVGIVADQLVMLSGQGGNQFSPFAIDGGQVFMSSAMIKDGTLGSAKIAQEIGSNNWYTSNASQGWMINKDGRAYFRQVEVTGTVWANAGYFTGEIRAHSGYMNNVTIGETCVILGTLWANKINGPLMQAKSFAITHANTNANSVIYWDGTAGRGDVPMTISGRIIRQRNNLQGASRVIFSANGSNPEVGALMTYEIGSSGTQNVTEYSFSFDVGTSPANLQLYAGALNQGRSERTSWSVQIFAAPTANQFHL